MSYDQANLDKMTRSQLEPIAALNDVGGNWKKAQISLGKLDQKDAETAADKRHGEEMTAAAVANSIALQAIRKADSGIFLARLAIAVSLLAIGAAIGLGIWQHHQG